MGDVCIGIVEDTEFWVDKDLFEYWKHAHFTLTVIDAFGVGGFSLETPLTVSYTHLRAHETRIGISVCGLCL